jgi:hypothetical protein
MKAEIYEDNTKPEKVYRIIIKGENVVEELALNSLSRIINRGYKEVLVDVMGIGLFVPYKSIPKEV